MVTDRLGSVRANGQGERFSYYPYGEERTTTVDGREKFGTYFRDLGTGLDYAEQRYYGNGAGRFWSPDPYRAGGTGNDVANPSSWNRYSYVRGDPINFLDRRGTCGTSVDDENGDAPAPDPCPAPDPTGGPMPAPEGPPPSGTPAAGGSGGPTSGLTAAQAAVLSGALSADVRALQSSSCRGLFGNGYDPATLLKGLFGSGETTITVGPGTGSGILGTWTIVSAFINLGSSGPLGLTIGPLPPPAVADIVVVINSALFTSDGFFDLEITLLHELGHVYSDLPGSGGSQVSQGLGDITGANDDLIVKNCLSVAPTKR